MQAPQHVVLLPEWDMSDMDDSEDEDVKPDVRRLASAHDPLRNSLSPETSRRYDTRPVADVRYDAVGHWPEYSQNRKRCKECIKYYSRMRCSKCNVALCLNRDRNCYKVFHVIK